MSSSNHSSATNKVVPGDDGSGVDGVLGRVRGGHDRDWREARGAGPNPKSETTRLRRSVGPINVIGTISDINRKD